jgi:phosphoribosyl-ATP pyrophosphohydrolase
MNEKTLGAQIDALAALIETRRGADAGSSYTAALLQAGPAKCAKKLGEEGVEAALAAVSGDKAAMAAEAGDLIYHLLVTLAACQVSAGEVAAVLAARTGVSGHEEKARRD